jgi:hypothetical protein
MPKKSDYAILPQPSGVLCAMESAIKEKSDKSFKQRWHRSSTSWQISLG